MNSKKLPRNWTALFLIPTVAITLISGCASTDKIPGKEPQKSAASTANIEELIKHGRYDEALNSYILPKISEFEKNFGHTSRKVYCTRTPLEALYYLAQSASKKEDAIALDWNYAEAYYFYGYILVEKHQNSEAKRYLQKAVDLAPNSAHILSELANIYQSEGSFQTAIEIFQQAIDGATMFDSDDKKATELRRAYRGKAYSLTELGKYDESEALYKKCLDIDPSDEKAKSELIYIKNLRLRNSINIGKY